MAQSVPRVSVGQHGHQLVRPAPGLRLLLAAIVAEPYALPGFV